jgi:pimeloyl-ACP methyl ester carboxylesterase
VPSIRIRDQNIEYEWIGSKTGEAPTIVFLHEGLGCVAMWRDFPMQVAKLSGCSALIYSRAGYGNSDPIRLPRPVSFMHEEALRVLPDVLDTFDIHEPILFGHSDGGSIALIYAGSGKGKVRGLILEASHVFVEQLSIESIIKAKDVYQNGSLKTSLERYHGTNVECAFRGWNEVWLNPEFRSWNIEEFLPNINVPVLVIQGENDQYGTMQQVEAIDNGCAGVVETLLLADCGHSPHRDRPDEVLQRTETFIGKL